jgi:thiamine-monophosphate kinase
VSRPGEDELIATYFAPLAGEGGLGLQDDAALFTPMPAHDLVTTVDALVAGVHFFPDDPAASIAIKALGVNLSDLAAKGASPTGFVLALALPADWRIEWVRDFAEGLGRAAADAACPLLGGDTVRTPGPLMLSITAFGQVPAGGMVRRGGARAGDRLYVSGTVGDAALGLRLKVGGADPSWPLEAGQRAHLIDRYLHPRPRLALASVLRTHASGAMDISDGLAGDAAKMAAASGVAISVELGLIPFSPAAQAAISADPEALEDAVTGGDDYEILAAVSPQRAVAFQQAALQAGVAVAPIGEVTVGRGLRLLDPAGRPARFDRLSFSHF